MTQTPEDLEQLATRLDQEPRYEALDIGRLRSLDDISALTRFATGDLVRVARSSGGWSLGVVAGVTADERLRIVVRAKSSGQISIKEQSEASVRKANPLRIGDYVQLGMTPFWVMGIDGEGELLVYARSGERVHPDDLRARISVQIKKPGADADQTLNLTPTEIARLRASAPAAAPSPSPSSADTWPTRPLSVARPAKPGPYVPIEQILSAEASPGMFAGNRETDTVYNLRSPIAGAALHTNKGHNYKSWNEDGGALFADARGRLYLGVFDQAGGEGSDKNARGAASAIAATMFFEEAQAVAEKSGDDREVEAALIKAAFRAHQAIIARGKGEVTTFVGAMVDRELALVVNIGDSGAQHYSRAGKHVASTEAQGIGRVLLEGLGMIRKAMPQHVTYRWKVAPGDYLVFGSDGLFDSRMKPEEIGQLIAAAGNAADATRKLRDVVSERMKSRAGKPDNLTVVVVRVGDDMALATRA